MEFKLRMFLHFFVESMSHNAHGSRDLAISNFLVIAPYL